MKSDFIDRDFLLQTPVARTLYHEYVEGLPIVDYHNHLAVGDLLSDRRWNDIGELWVAGDPYKHRAMRMCGVEERMISGDASTREKFDAWCRVFRETAGGPLFHWSLCELRNVFGVALVPSAETADAIWEQCNARLREPGFSTLAIMRRWGCKRLTTSNDLTEDISLHVEATRRAGDIEITPSLRADSVLAVGAASFSGWLEKLSPGSRITSLDDYCRAIAAHLEIFGKSGCRLSDHALDNGFVFKECSDEAAARLFGKVLAGGKLDAEEETGLKSWLLLFLGKEYATRGWIMQLHVGAERFTSSRLRSLAGAAGGYASIGRTCDIRSLCSFMDRLDMCGRLPKTILFTLNPADNAALATLTGSYSEDGVEGKIMYGPAWWYNDHLFGMEEQLKNLASYSLLPTFVGMTTDSRNILSFSRHDYFRRILCNALGEMAERRLLPSDEAWLGQIAGDIAYRNAEKWVYNNE